MMRYILIGCCFFCSLFLSSCNSTKRLGLVLLVRSGGEFPQKLPASSVFGTVTK